MTPRLISSLLIIICICIVSCNSEEKEAIQPQIKIQVTLPEIESDSISQKSDSYSTSPAYGLATIINKRNEPLLKYFEIALQKVGNTYESDLITLPAGHQSDYRLAEFIILDATHKIQYITPVQGSNAAHLVDRPLVMEISIHNRNPVTINPAVVRIHEGDLLEKYGYDLRDYKRRNIVYKNLRNFQIGHTDVFAIDIDSNGIDDYAFTTGVIVNDAGEHYHYRFVPLKANTAAAIDNNVIRFNEGDFIGSNQNFQKLDIESLVIKSINSDGVVWTDSWSNNAQQYIGVHFHLTNNLQNPGTEKYYGWIRISFNKALEKIIVHDMAYMTIPHKSIKAGQMR